MLDHLKELADGIVNRTLMGEEFVVFTQIHGELQKLSPEEFEASKRSEFLRARGAFERLVNPHKHQSITGSMINDAAKKLRPVLDHYVGPVSVAQAGSIHYTHAGDVVMSDKISIGGDVMGSAIGSHAKVEARDISSYKQMVQSVVDADLREKLVAAREKLETLPLSPTDKDDTAENLGKLTEEMQKERPEPGRIKRFLNYIGDIAPSVASVLRSAVSIGKLLSGSP